MNLQALEPEVRRELQVRLAVADHEAVLRIDGVVTQVVGQQAGLRLAAVAAVGGRCGQKNSASKSMPCEAKRVRMKSCGSRNVGFRERVRAEPVLVAHEHEAVAGSLESQQRRNHARQQADLGEAVDLLVGRLLDQRAVAIDEQDACSTHGCSTAASSRWFCSGVPIEMRRQFASPG